MACRIMFVSSLEKNKSSLEKKKNNNTKSWILIKNTSNDYPQRMGLWRNKQSHVMINYYHGKTHTICSCTDYRTWMQKKIVV